MKTKYTLLATGALVALLYDPAGAADINNYPSEHLGARHLPFTGTHTILGYTDGGTPTPDGHGFRDAQGTSELTLSVPSLGITDMVIPFSIVANADRNAEGNGTSWGTLEYRPGPRGSIHLVGRDYKISDTLHGRTRQYGGAMWTGMPLAEAHLLATEEIEETLDSNGAVINRVSVVEGILIVPFYANFIWYQGIDMDSLPPLKPVTEIPTGMEWQPHVLDGDLQWVASNSPPGKVYDYLKLSNETLNIRDLWILAHGLGTPGYAQYPAGRRYSTVEFLPMGAGGESCGRASMQGFLGMTERVDNMEWTGVFHAGPLAGCIYLHSEHWKPPFNRNYPTEFSAVILVPDYVDLDLGDPQKMLNISERGRVGTGDDILIAGFVVSGKAPRTILVRAIGPSLAPYGVTDFLEDPELKVFRTTETGSVLVATNDNWQEGDGNDPVTIMAANEKVGAFQFNGATKDAELLFSWLEPGAYTAQVSGVGDTTGVALVEVYEMGN